MTGELQAPSMLTGERFDAFSHVAGRVAHDFGNLLMPLLEYPQLVRPHLAEGGSGGELLDLMEKTARDMEHVTRQLAALSMRRGDPQEANLNLLIEGVVNDVRENGTRPDVTVCCDLSPDLGKQKCMVEQIASAVRNLCLNATEASSEGGAVTVRTECVGGAALGADAGTEYVQVVVVDHGTGIPAELRGRLFEPFVGTKKADRARRGAGLGLCIVWRAAREHDGVVRFEETAGGGSTFIFAIPTAGGHSGGLG